MDWRGAALKRYLTPELIAETTVLSRTCSLIGGSRERPTAAIVGYSAHSLIYSMHPAGDTSGRSREPPAHHTARLAQRCASAARNEISRRQSGSPPGGGL